MKQGHAAMLLAMLAFLSACEDNGKSADLSVDGPGSVDLVRVEAACDAPADLPLDAAMDAVGDAAGEGTGDAGGDASAKETGGDGQKTTDGSSPPIWGYVTRSVAPVQDGKGNIYVGLYLTFLPPPAFMVAGTVVKSADMSSSGAKIKYEIANAGAGNFVLWAFLDDNSNVFPLLPVPDAGDLVMSATKPVTVPSSGSLQVDVVLNKVEASTGDGGLSDALASLGALKGKISASAVPSLDGKGTIYITVHSSLPPAGQVLSTFISGCDLSSPYNYENYYLSGITKGNYYLQVYLDDNNNYNIIFPGSDTGDLIHSKPLQVHVLGGVANVHDIVLDAVK